MHSSIGITDSIYAVLSDNDMQERITGLGQVVGATKPTDSKEKIAVSLREILAQLEALDSD